MIKRLLLIAVITLGIASSVSADMPWPECFPCQDAR
jgi:hypothetical protein